MRKTKANKLLDDLTRIKTNVDTYIPVQVVRLDDDDIMLIVQTVAPLDIEHMEKFKELAKSYKVDYGVAGTFVKFQ